MLDKTFSLKAFEECGIDSKEARILADKLQDAVTKETQEVLLKKMNDIVSDLNAMGHSLSLAYEPKIGDISFIDKSCEKTKLRLSIDVVVSAGFSHYYNE